MLRADARNSILIAGQMMASCAHVDDGRKLRRLRVVQAWLDICHQYADDPLGLPCIHAVALATKESQPYVKQWCTRYANDGSKAALEDLPRTGRPRIADRADVAAMLTSTNPATSLRDASARSFQALGVQISRSTVARAAHELALHKHVPRFSLKLSDQEKVERQKYAQQMRRHGWSSTLMIDSTMIVMHPAPSVETGKWGPSGEVLTTETSTRSPKMHVYAGASHYGLSQLHPVTGTTGLSTPYYIRKGKHAGEHVAGVCQEECLVVLPAMIQEAKQTMPARVQPKLRVIMDKASVHTSFATARFMAQARLDDYLLPSKSSDMNWMDWAIWHTLKERVWSQHLIYGDDFNVFTKIVHEQWSQLAQGDIMQSLCQSQRARMECIAKDGELIH